jgi:hypothetical protein
MEPQSSVVQLARRRPNGVRRARLATRRPPQPGCGFPSTGSSSPGGSRGLPATEPARSCCREGAAGPVPSTAVTTVRRGRSRSATPWGAAILVEEVRVAQRAGDRRFATTVQLLESADGEPLVRVAYSTDGVVRRGPVTLRAQDLERLRAAVAGRPRLAAALGCAVGRLDEHARRDGRGGVDERAEDERPVGRAE